MPTPIAHRVLTYCIATIWLVNGLFCKLLHMVPRHEQIVARILGSTHSAIFTQLIGVSEILMAVWIVTRIKPRLNAGLQMLIIATMNTIEFLLARDLLLFGGVNAVLAAVLIAAIYYNNFVLGKPVKPAR